MLKAYGTSDPKKTGIIFKPPTLSFKVEVGPSRSKVVEGADAKPQPGKPILRLQIFDQQCNTTESLYRVFDAFTGTGIASKIKREGTGVRRHPRHQEIIENQYKILETDLELIKKVEIDKKLVDDLNADGEGMDYETLVKFAEDKYALRTTTIKNLKEALYKLTPALIYGTAASGIIQAKLNSQNDSATNTLGLLRQPGGNKDPEAGEDSIPLQILPTQLEVETLGCPYVTFGQNFFIDFGTNSSADNFYTVYGINHSITPGEFKTHIKFMNTRTYARYASNFDSITQLAIRVHLDAQKK